MASADRRTKALVIGAGPAGLAAGAMLRRAGIETLLVDRGDDIGEGWRRHYDRLHLHTVRWLSNLPGLPIPRAEGKWVSRDGVARYLQAYVHHHGLDVRLRTEVTRLDRRNSGWVAHIPGGALHTETAVVATGYNRIPWVPEWPGRESFAGRLIHSSRYRHPGPYRGQEVLVVGPGNSGAEIAVDLAEGGARRVHLSVRTPPNILRRDLAGLPTQVLGTALRRLPAPVVDAVAAATRRLTIGDLSRYGIPSPPRGTYTRVREDDRIPILDVGLIRMLKAGRIQVVAAVERFESTEVILSDGTRLAPDAVVAATGFRRGLEGLVGHLGILGKHGRPVVHGPVTHPSTPGLHFIGYTNPISGNLRELGIDARKIAGAVGRRRRRPGAGVA
ncbi:MAG: flavin-containing monooxygenase [Actinomycetota bacterium]